MLLHRLRADVGPVNLNPGLSADDLARLERARIRNATIRKMSRARHRGKSTIAQETKDRDIAIVPLEEFLPKRT